MNKKEWESKKSASKNSENIDNINKPVSPESLIAESKAATFANLEKTSLNVISNSAIQAALGITRMSRPNLAVEGVSARIAKLDTKKKAGFTKPVSDMFGSVKFNLPEGEILGAATMATKKKSQLLGLADSSITNMLNYTRVNIPSLASVGASAMLKDVQPSLAASTNQAILNLVNGVKTSAFINNGTKISSAIAPDLTKGAFKGVAYLLGGVQSAASISKAFEPNLTGNIIKSASDILKGMNTEPFKTSNSAVSATTKSLSFKNLHNSVNTASISMDGMTSILKSLQEYQDSIADICQMDVDEILENIDSMDSDVDEKPENQTQTTPLFTNEEFNETLDESFNDQVSFQRRVANWTEEKKKQYFIVIMVIELFVQVFIMPYLQQNVGLPVMTQVVSFVKELPEKSSKVLDKLEKGMEALITENTNYYYKVTYTDENGEVKEGYVAKRNLKIIDEQEKVDEARNMEE